MHSLMRRSVAAVLLILTFVLQGTTSVLAGTTGTISGTVTDASTNQPIAGLRVTAASPSQTATAITDAGGHYAFLSLAPDTYTVSTAAANGHDAFSAAGITVQADQVSTVSLTPRATLQQIGSTTSRATTALVRPGTTADVYSINTAQQNASAQVGGGGNLNSAWSAIATVPGVFVAPQQNGYIGAAPSLSIRGGDYNQIGYELDGIPVNRAFDNYPSGTLSALGQQELQVYTGAPPATAQADAISGFINQVIRTGTAPASRNLTFAVGSPTYYNKAAFETGGATPSRTFSYYVGLGGYDQSFRYFDQFNGASLQNTYGAPVEFCQFVANRAKIPSCNSPSGADYTNGGATYAFALAPPIVGPDNTRENVRDSIVNLHFGIPKKDGTKDDVQLLFDVDHATNQYYDSFNDISGGNTAFGLNILGGNPPAYVDGLHYNGTIGSVLNPAMAPSLISTYYFPGSPTGRSTFANGACTPASFTVASGCISPATQDAYVNDQNVFKLQYQHNFGTNAFLRVYGYTYYSDWLNVSPVSAYGAFVCCAFEFNNLDYELSSHTRGVSLEFADQINSHHLLTIQGNYTTSSTVRDNNTEMVEPDFASTANAHSAVAVVVNAAAPSSGYCFSAAGVLKNCLYSGGAQYITLNQVAAGAIPALPGACPVPGVTSTACEYLTVGNGSQATYNTVRPHITSFALTDNWRPSDKLSVDLGLREDVFQFATSSSNESAARTLYYNTYNLYECFQRGGTGIVTKATPAASCPAGYAPANIVDQNGGTTSYNEFQPRIGATFTIDPTTVVRASYGRYAQAPNSAFEQYDALQANQPNLLYNTYGFQAYGFNSSLHAVGPEVSNNYDLSFEKQLGRDLSMKITPFLRTTQGQIQQFYLNVKTSFVSGLNVGNQKSSGVEFEIDKGDFARNGLAAKLSFTYTNSYINYNVLPNGTTVLDPINANIKNYNAYTSFCASNPADPRCTGGATASGAAPSPCYSTAGAPIAAVGGACAAGTIANPYWNAPVQALLNPKGNYPTFDIFPAGPGTNSDAYGAPYIGTLVLQYKKGPLAIAPALQFIGGAQYGAPSIALGVAPDLCSATIAGTNRYDIASCTPNGAALNGGLFPGYNVPIPDAQTGRFDGMGGFRAPNYLLLHTQISYDVNKRLSLVGTFANIWHSCFGGTKVPWAVAGACGYGPNNLLPAANNTNPGYAVQPLLQPWYLPLFNTLPFNMYVEARLKL